RPLSLSVCLFFNAPPPTEFYTLSLHDALPISRTPVADLGQLLPAECLPGVRSLARPRRVGCSGTRLAGAGPEPDARIPAGPFPRSEEHTSELQSRFDLVCRLLLEKKKETNENR